MSALDGYGLSRRVGVPATPGHPRLPIATVPARRSLCSHQPQAVAAGIAVAAARWSVARLDGAPPTRHAHTERAKRPDPSRLSAAARLLAAGTSPSAVDATL
ncbi:hypothetical protein [Pseudoxanthomonas sp. UTMC 1351]|uniref:hypothetical protein n=1 Tax=Pseudoxanthomonas sp. UTMC 1351 TaxID=2695853 RepID=UPI0034CF27B7